MKSENETRTFLRDLYNSIVLRDIVQRTGAKEVDLINRIMEYLMLNPSQTFSAKGILNYFKSVDRTVSAQTLYNYLELADNYPKYVISMDKFDFSRACLKNAFRQMCVTICGRFAPNEGRIAGYVT